MKTNFKFKKLNIEKEQRQIILVVAVAAVVSVFCLVSAKALLSQAAYHRKVINAKNAAVKQMKANVDSVNTLKTQYEAFNSMNPNAIGGKNTSSANAVPPDGDNSRVVLDALPTNYDFPALITSVAKIMSLSHIGNPGVSGSDQSASTSSDPSSNPQPIEIPLTITGMSSYGGAQSLIGDFERSTRPFDITHLQLSGTSDATTISATVKTYFQPAKILNTGTQEVK